jgi:hypothetical protein
VREPWFPFGWAQIRLEVPETSKISFGVVDDKKEIEKRKQVQKKKTTTYLVQEESLGG